MFKLQDLQSTDSWGPGEQWHLDGVLKDVPFAPFSKGDKLGRAADWTAEGKDGRDSRNRSGYNRSYRDQYQAYGAGAASSFAYQHGEDEASFSVVDSRSVPKPRTYNRLGNANRGRGGAGQRGGRGQLQRLGGRGGGRGGGAQQGGRWGQGSFRGRRFGWKDYDKPQRLRDASVQIKPDWKMLEEIEFNRLSKLNFPAVAGEDVETAGFVYQYDKTFDRLSPRTSKPLQVIEKAIYNPTTTDDPMMEQLSEANAATVFATDSILSMMMCANRSVYPWDIVVVRDGDKLYFDKRPNSAFDYVTVNENAVEPPLEVAEGTKDQINTAGQLSSEATFIIQNFSQQALNEKGGKYEFQHANPFNVEDEDVESLASRGYRYRKFDLTTDDDDEEVSLIVRAEVDGFIKSSGGDDQFITVKALNEFDSKSHSAIDWRSKLDAQRGAVVATEMKNNSCKLARWAMQSVLADAAFMKIGYVSRTTPRDNSKHVILAVGTYKPRDFAAQMNVQLTNAWGIVRAIIDICRKRPDGKYVLVKDPNKPILRIYEVPQDDDQLNGYGEEEQQET